MKRILTGIRESRRRIGRSLLLTGCWLASLPALHAAVTTTQLRCEYLENPLGIDETSPRLSWIVESLQRGERQTAYQILVASTPEALAQDQGDLWDSGKVVSGETAQIAYAGSALGSRARCYWKVRAWNKDDQPSAWSPPASWSIGLLQAGDWSAQWIDGLKKGSTSQATPVVTRALYEATDGAGSLDVTAKLTAMAQNGTYTLTVSNTTFGNDPAYNHVKRLRVEYTMAGVTGLKYFAENATLNFPGDLPQPVNATITGAFYEAVDGTASLNVTTKLTTPAQSGSFALLVGNAALGPDPAVNHLKRLRVEYQLGGQGWTKYFAENTTFNYPADLAEPSSVPYLRKSFALAKPVRSATLYATALGVYELTLNQQRVGDHILAPEWTDYRKRLRYQTYDVTAALQAGQNVLGAQVANGWYSGHIGNGGFQYWGTSPALYAQLEVTYTDGTSERIVTDSSWKVGIGPMLSTDFMLGEEYDARRELAGWSAAGYDDSAWAPAVVRSEAARTMSGQTMEPVRQLMELQPKALTQPATGKWTYDLGQNMVGVVRLKITAAAGTKLTLRHAEMLNPDGTVYTANLRGAPSIDTYICKGGGEEVWQPKFTFHGFRYVELTGIATQPPIDAITGIVIGSATPQAGEFACSNPLINQLQSNIQWGQRGNYLSVPTDCPQRDERLGWMGDAQVFVRTATYNADVAAFFTKWLVDVTDSQDASGVFADVSPYAGPSKGTPAWGDAGVICPWTIYQAYGDLRALEKCYPAMVKWVEWCKSQTTNSIRDRSRGSDYGDWLSIGADTNKELIGTAYYAYSTRLVAQSAAALGKTADAAKYEALFQTIRTAFIAKYVTADGHITGNTQCAYAMALKFDLLPTELRANAANYLEADIIAKGNHLSTGFVGVSYLLPTLTQSGKPATAYRLLLQDTFPSWLFSVKLGATTIWERWDGWTPDKGFQDVGMNSFNHYSLGSCGEWLYNSVAGIDSDPTAPAFKKIVIRPLPGGDMTAASGKLRSIRGTIASAWSSKDGTFALNVEIPANTSATVYIPATDAGQIRESGKPVAEAEGVTFLRMENGAAVYSVLSGRYQFTTSDAPLEGADNLSRDPAAPTMVSIAQLLANDPAGSTFLSVSPLSVKGASLEVIDGSIRYTPLPGDTTGEDYFIYTIRDSQGGISTRVVKVSVAPGGTTVLKVVLTQRQPDGALRVVFAGVPGQTYRIESSETLVPPDSWNLRATVEADGAGSFELIDSPPLPTARFYRAVFP